MSLELKLVLLLVHIQEQIELGLLDALWLEVELSIPARKVGFHYVEPKLQVLIRVELVLHACQMVFPPMATCQRTGAAPASKTRRSSRGIST